MYHSKVGMEEIYQSETADKDEMDEEQCGMYDPTEDDDDIETAPPGELTQSQKDNIKDIYHMIDADKSGELTLRELRKGLQLLGMNPTVKDIRLLAKKHKIEGRKVNYEEFERIMAEELLSQTNQEFDLLEAFRIFDKDKNGTLDKQELKVCLQSLGEQLNDEEVDELFDALDTDRSGTLSLLEASKLLA